MKISRYVHIGLLTIGFFALNHEALAQTYTFEVLNFPGSGAYATGISNDGFITGIGSNSYLRTPQESYIPIDYPGRIYTTALGLNNNGVIVGDVWNPDTLSYIGFIRASDGTFTNFIYPNAYGTNGGMQTNAINDNGVIVGGYATNSTDEGAFVRSPTATFSTFQYLGDLQTVPYGINNFGYISGQSNHKGSFLRDPDGNFTPIEYPDVALTQAFGLNNLGQVAGDWYDPALGTHGFIRDTNGSFLTIDFPGAKNTIEWDINDTGQLVGYFDTPDNSRYAFLATPVPLPAAFWLFGSGLIGLFGFMRRGRARKQYAKFAYKMNT